LRPVLSGTLFVIDMCSGYMIHTLFDISAKYSIVFINPKTYIVMSLIKNFFTVALFFVTAIVFAQAPQGMNYQAVVRDAVGVPVPAANLAVRFSIHDSVMNGPVVFTETQPGIQTNQLGIFTARVGAKGDLSLVAWGSGPKFLQVEIEINNSGMFVDMGTSQLLSVPYALYAENAPIGPAGPAGPQGAPGPAGLPGPAGSSEDTITVYLDSAGILSIGNMVKQLIPPPGAGKVLVINWGLVSYSPGTLKVSITGKLNFFQDACCCKNGDGQVSATILTSASPIVSRKSTSVSSLEDIENKGYYMKAEYNPTLLQLGSGYLKITLGYKIVDVP
jgi:hypothetical protein